MGRFLDRLNKYFMKKYNDLENGRSMVEMLGVLAIVGVITIGGIVGYRYAMDYIMTNAIITGIRARAVIVIQQRVLGYELNLQEFHPNTPKDLIYGRFRVEAVNNYLLRGEEHQALEVFNIPHRVCKNIYNTAFGEEITLIVNEAEENPNGLDPCLPDGVTEDSVDEEDIYHNVVAFVFGNGAPCEDDSDCPNAVCYECSPLGMCIPKAKDTPCGTGGCCDGNGGCTLCVIACDPDEVASTCRTSCDTSTGTWNLKAAGSKCGANNCGVCNSDGQCVGDNTKTITKCDGTPEVCCAADADCKDESPCAIPCTGTAPACQTCDTTRGEFVADATQNGTAVGACGMCQDGAIVQRTGVSVGDCKKCDLATGDIVNDNSADGSTCGTSCGQCNNGSCDPKATTITKCDGSTESCCPLNGNTCENARNCECPSGYQTNSCTTTTLDTKTLGDGTTCYKCEAPSCPNGGDFGTDGTTCCKNGYAWYESSNDYAAQDVSACGCPDGGYVGEDKTTCCKDNYAWVSRDTGYSSIHGAACGCPDNGVLTNNTTCCKDGYSWNGSEYSNVNGPGCGCPDGGSLGSNGVSCCQNGFMYDSSSGKYLTAKPTLCGCPDGGKYQGNDSVGYGCCKDGKLYNNIKKAYITEHERCSNDGGSNDDCEDSEKGCDGVCGSGKVVGCDGVCDSGKTEDCDGVCGGNNTTGCQCRSLPVAATYKVNIYGSYKGPYEKNYVNICCPNGGTPNYHVKGWTNADWPGNIYTHTCGVNRTIYSYAGGTTGSVSATTTFFSGCVYCEHSASNLQKLFNMNISTELLQE